MHNKLDCFSLSSLSALVGEARSQAERCLTLVGSGLTRKHGLGWRGLPDTNTLAYYKHLYIADVKDCISLVPVVEDIKLFYVKHVQDK